jgi:hypothetical protein
MGRIAEIHGSLSILRLLNSRQELLLFEGLLDVHVGLGRDRPDLQAPQSQGLHKRMHLAATAPNSGQFFDLLAAASSIVAGGCCSK